MSTVVLSYSGQSSVNFIYNLVEESVGAHGDFSLKEGHPLSGQGTFMAIVCSFLQFVKFSCGNQFSSLTLVSQTYFKQLCLSVGMSH